MRIIINLIIDFAPLFETLIKAHITQYQLINEYDISAKTINSLKNNQNVELFTIMKLMIILNTSNINDVLTLQPVYKIVEK